MPERAARGGGAAARAGSIALATLGVLLLAGGAVCLAMAARAGRGAEPLVVTASGDGPLAPVPEPAWDPAELGHDRIEVDERGRLTITPDPGITTLAELARVEAAELGLVARGDGAGGARPTRGSGGTGSPAVASLVGYVPDDAYAVIAVDGAAVQPVEGVRLAFARLARAIDGDGAIDRAARAGGYAPEGDGAAVLLAALPVAGRDLASWLVVAHGRLDPAAVEGDVIRRGGRVTWRGDATGVELRDGRASILAFPDRMLIAEPEVIARALDAAGSAGGAAPLTRGGPLRPAVERGLGSAVGFAAVRLGDRDRAALTRDWPDLARAEWLAVSLALPRPGEVVVSAVVRLPDAGVAGRAAAALRAERDRLEAALAGRSPGVARALARFRFAAAGAADVAIDATLSDDEVRLLVEAGFP